MWITLINKLNENNVIHILVCHYEVEFIPKKYSVYVTKKK